MGEVRWSCKPRQQMWEPLDSRFWTLDTGHWTLDSGVWSWLWHFIILRPKRKDYCRPSPSKKGLVRRQPSTATALFAQAPLRLPAPFPSAVSTYCRLVCTTDSGGKPNKSRPLRFAFLSFAFALLFVSHLRLDHLALHHDVTDSLVHRPSPATSFLATMGRLDRPVTGQGQGQVRRGKDIRAGRGLPDESTHIPSTRWWITLAA